MTLTRALPAFLALSLLTGCDINAFLPKPTGGKGAITNPDPNEGQLQLSEAELKSVNALKGGLFEALEQGSTTAGIINTLKSVAAFTGEAQGYRVASVNASSLDLETIKPLVSYAWLDSAHPKYDKLKDKFSDGSYGEGAGDGYKAWGLSGRFKLDKRLGIWGRAFMATNGQTPSFDKMGDFEAKLEAEVWITSATVNGVDDPDLKDLVDSEFVIKLNKPKGPIQDYLSGEFTQTKLDRDTWIKTTSTGLLEIDLLNETWTITMFSKGEQNKDVAIRLTYDPKGGSVARVYDVKKPESDKESDKPMVPNFDSPVGLFTSPPLVTDPDSSSSLLAPQFTYFGANGQSTVLTQDEN